jgi:catechol 2,3-dioxygenase-like lactoylglutathione lyase family enzyme
MAIVETLGVDHVTLTVNDVERSGPFYDKVLGALGFERIPGDSFVSWQNDHMNIDMVPAAAAEKGLTFNRYRVGLHHLAFKAKAKEDVDRFYQFLVSEQVTILDSPAAYPQYAPHYYAVFFADPDGMKLELVHFPRGYWQGVQTAGEQGKA